ncbi:MAG TPA: hypothetical protein VFE98_02430 [Candidatus Bathyarchaeia archaeon]|nr:hypothetical protein [Candidatus Bathyarchaeia archaeon]
MDKILISTYSSETAEWNDLRGNNLDLTDWTLGPTDLPNPCPSPPPIPVPLLCDTRFYVTAAVAGYNMFGIDFNNANNFFGINFGSGRDGSSDSLRAIYFRQGVAHLVDKAAFISKVLSGLGQAMDNPLPPGQGISHSGQPYDSACVPQPSCTGPYTIGGYRLGGICSWDILHPTAPCLSAFKIGSDTSDSAGIVTASASNPDFCDAADHWIAAGLGTTKAADCHIADFSGSGSINFVVRSDNAPRLALGDSLAGRMCELINGAGVTSCPQILVSHLSIQDARPIVFSTVTQHLDWHMYTKGWALTVTPDQIWALYHSQFAGRWCGGPAGFVAPNYVYFCNSKLDHYSSMVEFNSTTSGAIASMHVANEIYGNHTVGIDVYALGQQFAYLKGWTGVNNGKGVGPPNTFTLMNVWKNNPAVVGNIRWGFKQGTNEVNPLTFSSLWEGFIVGSVFDTLVVGNPYSPSDLYSWMVNQWQFLAPQPGDPPGTAADVKFSLRNDIFFHNGKQVTSSDYLFSWLAFAATGGLINPLTAGIVGVRIQNDFNFVVNLNSNSVFALQNIGGIPLIPQHLWASDTLNKCTTPGTPACLLAADATTRDPIATYRYVGSGPWVCQDLNNPAPAGIGGKCSKTGTQGVGAQLGAFVLQRDGLGVAGTTNSAYFRDSAKYKQWQWADVFNHGIVDILDVSLAASCLGMAATGSCAHWDTPAATITCVSTAGTCNSGSMLGIGGNRAGIVSFIEIQQAFRWFSVSWTSPLSYSQLVGAQALASQTLYEGGVQYAP